MFFQTNPYSQIVIAFFQLFCSFLQLLCIDLVRLDARSQLLQVLEAVMQLQKFEMVSESVRKPTESRLAFDCRELMSCSTSRSV